VFGLTHRWKRTHTHRIQIPQTRTRIAFLRLDGTNKKTNKEKRSSAKGKCGTGNGGGDEHQLGDLAHALLLLLPPPPRSPATPLTDAAAGDSQLSRAEAPWFRRSLSSHTLGFSAIPNLCKSPRLAPGLFLLVRAQLRCRFHQPVREFRNCTRDQCSSVC
jgi:hypothetical protein